MKNYKIEEKRFLESAILSNSQGLLSADWLIGHEPNYEQITTFSVNLALEQLKQRNELFGTKEKITPTPKKTTQNICFEEILEIFNLVCSALPQVTKLTKERENAINKILETYNTQDIGNVFKIVSESDYLCGKTVSWKADFDWIFIPKNFIKILEGKYKNIENGTQQRTNTEIAIDAFNSETAKNFRFK